MSLGIREAKRTRDAGERDLAIHQLRERLKLLESALEGAEAEGQAATGLVVSVSQEPDEERQRSPIELIREAKACLMV
jgi:hypothetical protein